MLEVKGSEGMYTARVSAPDAPVVSWETPRPMTREEVYGALVDLGCHQMDAWEATFAAEEAVGPPRFKMPDPPAHVAPGAIIVERDRSLYRARIRAVDSLEGGWETPTAMTIPALMSLLRDRGVHPTDVWNAIHECDADLPAEEKRRRYGFW